jgi:hypothetical protein
MRYILGIIMSFALFVECESPDKKFCECMKVSEEFNRINSEILTRNSNNAKLNYAKKIVAKKRKLCFDYKNMVGEELIKRKKACN